MASNDSPGRAVAFKQLGQVSPVMFMSTFCLTNILHGKKFNIKVCEKTSDIN